MLNRFETATNTGVTVATSDTAIVSANTGRKYLCLTNAGTTVVYLAFGATAIAGKGIYLAANGGSYEINLDNLFTGAIRGIAITSSCVVTVVES